MKKIIALVMAALIMAALLPAMTSCKGEDYGTTVLFMRPDVNVKDDTSPYGRAALRFEEETQQTVKFVTAQWGTITEKLTVQAAAGRPVEVFFTGGGATLWYANKGYAQEWNKYIDLDNPYLDKKVMDSTYKVAGKYYFATAASGLWGIYYNNDMFNEKGVDNPRKLYDEGNWNYDNFLNYSRLFLNDVDADGEYDKYGLSGWAVDVLLYANKASFCNKDDNGIFTCNFASQNLINGLELVRTIYNEGLSLDKGTNDGEFLKGNAAMFIERDYLDASYWEKEQNGKMGFDYGFVPLPYGPQNTEKINVSIGDGYMLGKDCKNPVGAGKFLDILITELGGGYQTEEEKAEAANRHKPESLEVINDMKANTYCFEANDEGLFESDVNLKWAVINESMATSVKSALDQYKTMTEKSCEKTNQVVTIEPAKPFTSFGNDFEDGAMTNLIDKAATGVSMSIVDSTEIVPTDVVDEATFAGKSLKLSFDKVTESTEYMVTDVKTGPIVGRRDYYLTFDYMFDGEFEGTLKGYLTNAAGDIFCDSFSITNMGGNVAAKCKFLMRKIDTDSGDLYFVFTAEGATGTIYIDNFAVVEAAVGLDE